ncbi:MAG: carotenoid 1,2-hydratase [Pseudomonadota bacterium]
MGFIGSVFSPWYRWSGRRDPANNCCINVATYGPGGRWAMTDRGAEALRLAPESLTVGPSSMRWTGAALEIEIDETTTPHLGQLSGHIALIPEAVTDVELPLTPDGAHVWRPFAPVARIRVELNRPGWTWEGSGYFDSNFGTAALEADFSYWTWGRFPTTDGALCFYDADRRDGGTLASAIAFDAKGRAREVAAPPKTRFARSLWAVRRETRADPGYRPRQTQAMLDAPFYSRSTIRTAIDGEEVTGVHEALDLDRFASNWLMPMLAVRVPRRRRWSW